MRSTTKGFTSLAPIEDVEYSPNCNRGAEYSQLRGTNLCRIVLEVIRQRYIKLLTPSHNLIKSHHGGFSLDELVSLL
jgi:hypothetical protein